MTERYFHRLWEQFSNSIQPNQTIYACASSVRRQGQIFIIQNVSFQDLYITLLSPSQLAVTQRLLSNWMYKYKQIDRARTKGVKDEYSSGKNNTNHWFFPWPNVSSTPFVTLSLRSAIISEYAWQQTNFLLKITAKAFDRILNSLLKDVLLSDRI